MVFVFNGEPSRARCMCILMSNSRLLELKYSLLWSLGSQNGYDQSLQSGVFVGRVVWMQMNELDELRMRKPDQVRLPGVVMLDYW